ncbi:hypothetical protein D3C75_396460 [compost metagenome]
MKRLILLLVLLFTLSACNNFTTNVYEPEIPVTVIGKEAKKTEHSAITKVKASTTSDFLAKDKDGLSVWDFETAYAMCVSALSDYYKAIWNGSDIHLDSYFDNKNLKQYMQQKITSQHHLFLKNKLTDNAVTGLDIGVEQVEFNNEGDFFYLKLVASVNKEIGSFAEPTEFLIQSLNGNLVIVDWYSSGKDSYDSFARGESQIINRPNIWNEIEWLEKNNLITN